MTIVNRVGPVRLDDVQTKHLGFLVESTARHLRRDIGRTAASLGMTLGPDGTFPDLRPSHFRLLSLIPPDGARVSDLSLVAGMTKQALGQFMDFMEERAYVSSAADPADRRVRVISRTPLGDEAVRRTDEVYAELEEQWREMVGPARWAAFRDVVEELAVGWQADEDD